MYLFKCIAGFISENCFAVNVLTRPKNFWNLEKSTLILFFYHFGRNWVGKFFLIKYEILGLLVNTLTANYEYSRSDRGNLVFPIQIKLSEKQLTFCDLFFCHCWYLHEISNLLKKKNELHRWSVSEVTDSKRCA